MRRTRDDLPLFRSSARRGAGVGRGKETVLGTVRWGDGMVFFVKSSFFVDQENRAFYQFFSTIMQLLIDFKILPIWRGETDKMYELLAAMLVAKFFPQKNFHLLWDAAAPRLKKKIEFGSAGLLNQALPDSKAA